MITYDQIQMPNEGGGDANIHEGHYQLAINALTNRANHEANYRQQGAEKNIKAHGSPINRGKFDYVRHDSEKQCRTRPNQYSVLCVGYHAGEEEISKLDRKLTDGA